MTGASQTVITRAEERPREAWDDPAKGSVAWHTLFSADITPTDSLSAGIAILPPGGTNPPHRHAEAELYFILEGNGVLTVDGLESPVGKGAAIFIPGQAWHSLRNEGDAELRLFYVFPTGRFSDVIYEFSD
ncbi:cupin domain-containing protein [Labrys sp. LIt4]|uniref:Cupin domain-containing protein n=1 Tax=Labrys okinawensis TaxID=346911 RepID=A0A2S9QDX3_9HYPH|nr:MULTISPECIES: cupin domain-containing protein [Labrys]MBP0579987.1 cupin domain-containing protein [Labrys sp. LIt4]PRH87549.1 cupin domain-containing protein [Labrys okinawensis]